MKKIKIIDLAILLLGVGIGVVLTSGIFYYNPNIKYKTYTDEQILAKATEIQLRDSRKKEETDKSDAKANSNDKNNEEKKSKKVKFIIEQGESIDEIINRLYELEIIDNKESFLDRLKVREATQKIHFGEYEFELSTNYDDIIDKLIDK